MNLDRDIMMFLDDHRDPTVTTMARWAMDVGLSPFVLLACGVVGLVIAIAGRWWRLGLVVGGAAVSAMVLTWVLKTIIARPRPPVDLAIVHTGGWSMPSTVAAITAAGAATLFLSVTWPTSPVRWVAGIGLTAVVAAVGCAMVYLGAHWPSDVLAGWLLGLGIAAVAGRAGRDQPIGSSEVGATS
ncbi:undecaprenyl-diphosphatase [Nocardia tenerifensis]|uniref:Undecaprenyl-diphosphatase n=1 Tax=Nocardia tenerifensis TaxID=228006 RepID=A0A318KC23_9NOCA|nr:phosphatase PAP2 family protein [Nocardia tenerifensis]PXX63031.1 undecaprenyl-diphosphatase [Nocardia tenerifensis]